MNIAAIGTATPETERQGGTKPTVYHGHCEVFRLRISRRHRRCEYSRDTTWFHPCSDIAPGQQYIHITVYPGHDFIDVKEPSASACCLGCASGYSGMEDLIPAALVDPTT